MHTHKYDARLQSQALRIGFDFLTTLGQHGWSDDSSRDAGGSLDGRSSLMPDLQNDIPDAEM